LLTDSFNAANQHFAIDIISRKNTAVKATLDGTVVFSGWTPETGHMIIMQHTDDWLSVYKHNALNFKKEGNFVHAGEAIAMVGNSGELTTGPHLHFELWHKGVPMNPRNYLYN
jgi:murein DD-endopeptidase MepM/ murein hydrolase activator NlpD